MRLRSLAALLLCAACGGATAPNSSDDVTGTYALSSGTSTLILQQANYKFEITGGTFTVARNFTWSFQLNFQQTQGSQVTRPTWGEHGTYKIEGTELTFADSVGAPTHGIVSVTNQKLMAVSKDLPRSIARAPDGSTFGIDAFFQK